ncbi:MAG: UDP-GlcNAc--UDP-phosphate GlcNAc-1-phosphate transferase, partial [Schleiferiaceae bacterium]|nr:UDP-GlcNAc--UDP-phosphate GlcNAc-1-phosphate transferase [Schleiferiaceae bacterium]
MTYLLVALALLVGMLAYLRLADHFNIIDKPNQRSSHQHITIRGGGIIFPVAVLLWGIFFMPNLYFLVGGLLLIGTISFLDDRYTLPSGLRIAVHLLTVGLLLLEAGFGAFPWFFWLIAFILIIG